MLARSITYENIYTDKMVTETFYFHLTKVEVLEMNYDRDNEGLEGYLNRIVAANDIKEVFELVKAFLSKAVGQRSDDERRFIKSDAIIADFVETGAYSELFFTLMTGGEKVMADFMLSTLPAAVRKDIAEEEGKAKTKPEEKAKEDYSDDELMAMTDEEFRKFAGPEKDMGTRLLRIGYRRATTKVL